jgi:F-type H+-transporting ATPase subunit b
MKRLVRLALLVAALASFGFTQEEKGHDAEKASREAEHEAAREAEHSKLQMWKWANFLLLAGAIGYVIGKNAPAFFAARSQQIGKDMAEAQQERKAAEERAAAVDLRLANLEAEIASLRARSQQEAETETQRLAQHTSAEIAKIQARAEQEIVSAGKAARLELKRHAAELAIGLAEQKIRARLTPETQDALVRGFVRDLK